MSADGNNRRPSVRDLFLEALDKSSPAERSAYLEEACGGDTALRAKVEALLQCSEADSFLDRSAAETLEAKSLPEAVLSERPGTVIGRYKLLEQIGEGGCGVVYVAEQTEPVRRRVALKVIKLGMDTRSVVARFEAERQALALMDHPNIAKVLDAGATETGRPFFVMELVRGIKITDYCDRNNLSMRERLDLFIPVCQAIQHAHQKGIIHRDIKPSNVLVTVNNGTPVPKVIDFGIAKATTQQRLTDKTLYTAFEQFIGTPAYMSPEQAEMTSLDIDTRSDIYALGVLLYELLTGKTPFDAKTLVAAGLDEMRRIIREKEPVRPSTRLITMMEGELATAAQHRRAEPPKLIHLVRGDLDWIVMKCLEKDRTRRYESATGLALDLDRHLKHEPVMARPPSVTYRTRKFVRRHKLTVTAAAAVTAALVLGVVVSTWQWFRADRERERAEISERKTRRNAYASDLNLVAQALEANNLGRATELLDRQIPETGQEDLRGWEWRYLWQLSQSDALLPKLYQASNAVYSLSVSHDGRWLAIGEKDGGRLSLLDLERRQVVDQLRAGRRVAAVFSPRDSLLAYSTETQSGENRFRYTIRLWNVEARQVVAEMPLANNIMNFIRLAFSQDGRTLVSLDNKHLSVWRVPEGTNTARWPISYVHGEHRQGFAVNRDCSLAAVTYGTMGGGPNGALLLIDLANGKERWRATANTIYFTSMAFSPDGKVLVSGADTGDTAIRFWDVTTGQEIAEPIMDHRAYVGDMLFLPDGKTLATASGDQTIRLWDVGDLRHVRPRGRPLRGHNLEILSLALLPDHRTLVSGSKDGEVYLWDTAAERPEAVHVTLPGTNLVKWCFGPDSKTVLTCDRQGGITEWRGPDFQESRPLFQTFAEDIGIYRGGCFSDGGRWFASRSNGVVRLWDVQRQTVVREFLAGPDIQNPWKFLDRGRKLIVLEESIDHLWDLTTVREVYSWNNPRDAYGAAVSADERWWIRIDSTVGMCSFRNLVNGGQTNRQLEIGQPRHPVISPDGTLLALPSFDNYVRLWNTSTGKPVRDRDLRGGLLSYDAATFSSDGKRLVTTNNDREALSIWDTVSWQNLLSLSVEVGGCTLPAFSPDGCILGARDSRFRLHLWRAPAMEEIESREMARAYGSLTSATPTMHAKPEQFSPTANAHE